MRTIVVANQKGGAGKTTLAAALAVEAQRCGDGPVVLVDTDPQGGLAAWWNARADELPAFADPDPHDLAGTLAQLAAQGFALAVIDTPPQVTDAIAEVVAVADLVLVPVRPSPNDLRAVEATMALIDRGQRRMLFVINAVKPRVRLTSEAAIALSQHGAVAPVMIADRADYAGAMTDGRTAPELEPAGKAAAEIAGLWTFVANRTGLNRAEISQTDAAGRHPGAQRKRRATARGGATDDAQPQVDAVAGDGAGRHAAQGAQPNRRHHRAAQPGAEAAPCGPQPGNRPADAGHPAARI